MTSFFIFSAVLVLCPAGIYIYLYICTHVYIQVYMYTGNHTRKYTVTGSTCSMCRDVQLQFILNHVPLFNPPLASVPNQCDPILPLDCKATCLIRPHLLCRSLNIVKQTMCTCNNYAHVQYTSCLSQSHVHIRIYMLT